MKERELFPAQQGADKGSIFKLDNTFAGAELEKRYRDDIKMYGEGKIGKIFPCHVQRNR